MGEQTKGYIVAGTICTMGEEVSARGKIMLFDVMEVSYFVKCTSC